MFLMEFDHRTLMSLPLPGEERVKTVVQLIRAIVLRRVLPYFRNRKGTDPTRLAQVADHLSIVRLEDEGNRIGIVSVVTHKGNDWTVHIHERIFDFLAFVLPGDPETRLSEGTLEEQKMLAFAEFFLRHQLEHVIYPERKEREIIASDVEFVLYCRASDPKFYRMLIGSLTDEMNGIKGRLYVTLFENGERGIANDAAVDSILDVCGAALQDAPVAFLLESFAAVDTDMKFAMLSFYYSRSADTSLPLLKRSSFLRKVIYLFTLLSRAAETDAAALFHAFRNRHGLGALFRELDLPETGFGKDPEDLFHMFEAALESYGDRERTFLPVAPAAAPRPSTATSKQQPSVPAERSLKDRIEAARENPAIPRRVIEVIDKNQLNIIGHSGSKYSEFIETLLAIPWGKIHKIRITPEEFEAGLNASHYGLQQPKEIIGDFFANLIWRYQSFTDDQVSSWRQTGSAFLLVGPPGVGKTSLAISIAQNLGIPYHKVSLGGMRDEADLRGHGFTYEGSKPGAIVQGLVKMEAMNGLFILDEADKTEKFAIATLLEILDPEQNHLFHDKYTETTVDIDLSNCHFFLTANTLETVPQVVANRCEVIFLDRYSVEEKIAIARQYLVPRVRRKYGIGVDQIYFDQEKEDDLLRYLISGYTYEPGVRELERIIRTLFLRVQRKEVLNDGGRSVCITRQSIKQYVREAARPRQVAEEDQVGVMAALGVDAERGIGAIIPIQATRVGSGPAAGGMRRGYLSIIHATGNIEKVMDESRKVATTGILQWAKELKIREEHVQEPIHLHFMGASTKKDGPSAGGAIALALTSILSERKIRRDVAMTGEIDTRGKITAIGSLALKLETAYSAGCRTVIIPKENLYGEGGIERFPDALKQELQILTYEEWKGPHEPFDYGRHILQVVAVDSIVQAADIACMDEEEEMSEPEARFASHATETAEALRMGSRAQVDRSMCIVQVKSPDELSPEFIRLAAFGAPSGVALLITPGIRSAILTKLGDLAGRFRIRDFDPYAESLSVVSQEILESVQEETRVPIRLSLVAPYYFLKRDGICPDSIPACTPFDGISLFANNYTLQGVKVKGAKMVLDRAYLLLGALNQGDLDRCPFLGRLGDLYAVDMAIIPEKYRLDVRRAGNILNRTITGWADAVEGGIGKMQVERERTAL